MAAHPQVVVSACVLSGDLTVRGWDRNEVRARISDGVQIELARVDQTKSSTPTELKPIAKGRRPGTGSGCLPLGDIELDVPRGANLKLQTSNGEISVTEVARRYRHFTVGKHDAGQGSERSKLNHHRRRDFGE